MLIAIMLVICSGLIHSIWNLLTKKSLNKTIFLWFCQITSFLIYLPWVIYEWDQFTFDSKTSVFIFLSFIVHGIYMVLLSKSYTVGDLSKVYPIMRGISPLVVPVIGVLFLNEELHLFGWIGIVFIIIGIFSLSDYTSLQKKFVGKDTILAILVGCCVASYMIIDKLALAYMPPVILNLFINLGSFIALSFFITNKKALQVEWKKNWHTILSVAVLLPASFLVFLYALSLAEVSLLAPMREIGTVFGAIFGIVLLKEKQGAKRIISSVIITIGVIILGIWN